MPNKTRARIETYTIADMRHLWVTDCAECGVVFAMPKAMEERRRKDEGSFYCPNGHSMWFGKGEADKQRERAERAERAAAWERSRRDQAEAEATHMRNVANGHKGAHQRTKNRVAKGVCPCCNRSFVDLAKHMAGQHPSFAGVAAPDTEGRGRA